MKALALSLAVAALAIAAGSAAAQEFGYRANGTLGSYDGYYDYDAPLPPRRVPHVNGATETVITTTRRIVTQPGYEPYGAPQAVVTTRRVIAPAPVYAEPREVVVTGTVAPPWPLPPRRIVKDTVIAPVPAERVVTRRLAAPPVVIEERRVETTRRIIGPAPLDWEE